MEDDKKTLNYEIAIPSPVLYKIQLDSSNEIPDEFYEEILTTSFNFSNNFICDSIKNLRKQQSITCGIFSKDVAETKAYLINDFAIENNYPNICKFVEIL